MKLKTMAAAALMLCGTGCGTKAIRIEAAHIDRAKLDECPLEVKRPADLPPLAPFLLPDGRLVVPEEQVRARDGAVTEAVLLFRGAWLQCRSAVIYAKDWDAALP